MKNLTTNQKSAAHKLEKLLKNNLTGSLVLVLLLALVSSDAKAQVPVAFYDFEDDARTTYKISADMSISGITPSVVTKGGGGTITGTPGAGKDNGGNSALDGMALTSSGWSTGNSMANPAPYYYQFSVNTTGLEDIFLSVNVKRVNQGPSKCGLQYSIDGGNTFVNQSWTIGNEKNINANFSNSSADFATVPDVDNKSVVYFRIVGYAANNTNGQLIIDNLTISAKTFTRSVTLLNESEIYAGVNGGLTGGVFIREGLSVSGTGTVVTMASDIAIGTNKDVKVENGATLDFGTAVNNLTGSGRFTLASGGTLKINSPQGISSTAGQGNIQLTGSKSFNEAANYFYEPNTTGTLVTGNALPAIITGDLTFSPGPATTNPIEFTQATTLSGSNNQISGQVDIGAGKTLSIGTGGRISFGSGSENVITGAGNFVLQAGATIDVTSPQGISTLAGQGNVQVTGTRTFHSGATYNYNVNAAGPLTAGNALPATITGNLNVNLGPLTDSPLTLAQNTTINGTLTNASGDVVVGIGNTLTLNGGLVLDGGTLTVGAASLALNGTAISGATAQTGLLTTTDSDLAFGGTAANITVPASVTTVRDLAINNANGVNVDAILEINGNLNLSSGNLRTTRTKKIRIKPTGRVSGGSTTSYVDGPMTYVTASTSSTTMFFPVGSDDAYRPVTLTVTQDQAIETEYTAEQIEGSHAPITIPEDELQNVSGIRYFSIDKGAGANITSGTVTLTYGADDDVSDPENLRIAKTNADYSAWLNIGRAATSSNANAGTITSDINFTSFSNFIIANARGGLNTLPVELASFEVTKSGTDVALRWATATEKNNKGFEIQMSVNGSEFRGLGFVESSNSNSASLQTYSFTDKEAGKKGTRYYRLAQTDFDGTTSYSPLRAVDFGKYDAEMAVYPNPFRNNLTIELAGNSEEVATIEITDALGNVVNVQELELNEGNNHVTVQIPDSVAKGLYTLSVITAEGTNYQKIVKR